MSAEDKPESCDTIVQDDTNVAQPLTVTIHKSEGRYRDSRMGKHTRKTKGKTYVNPRLLLGSQLAEHIGKRCRVFRAKASVMGKYANLPDKDVLIVVVLE